MTTIRKVRSGDREIFLDMVKEFYSGDGVLHEVSDEVRERTFDEMMRSDEYLNGYMFDSDGENAGYAIVSYSFSPEVGGKYIFIEEIFVKPEYRGQGIGHAFLDMLCARLGEDGVRRLRLEAVRGNEGAIRLYKKYGFCELDYMQMTVDRP